MNEYKQELQNKVNIQLDILNIQQTKLELASAKE